MLLNVAPSSAPSMGATKNKKNKKLDMKFESEISTIRGLISRDDLPQAISLTKALLEKTTYCNEAILHSARYSEITKQIRLGVIDTSTASITKSQIRNSILELLSEIENYEIKNSTIKSQIKNKYWVYLGIAILIFVILLLFRNNTNITGIDGNNNDNNSIKIDK